MAVLSPFISERDKGWARVSTEDGEADVYGIDQPASGLMFNHVGGRRAWDVIYAVASRAGFVVMPAGCGTLLMSEAIRRELPDGVPEPIAIVNSGAELLARIQLAE